MLFLKHRKTSAEEWGEGADTVRFRAQLAALELELRERDQRIQAMQAEYATLHDTKERMTATAGREQLERLCGRLATPLSNLAALNALARQGKTVEVGNLFTLFHAMEKELARAGLESIGAVGEQAPFDPAIHQPINSGVGKNGSTVWVRLPGYRFGEKVLLKAMVNTEDR